MRMLGASERGHGKAVSEGSEVLLELVWRPAGGDEENLVEVEAAVGGARNRQMAVVNGIEGAAEESHLAGMMPNGSALGLGCRQCASQSSCYDGNFAA